MSRRLVKNEEPVMETVELNDVEHVEGEVIETKKQKKMKDRWDDAVDWSKKMYHSKPGQVVVKTAKTVGKGVVVGLTAVGTVMVAVSGLTKLAESGSKSNSDEPTLALTDVDDDELIELAEQEGMLDAYAEEQISE